MNIIFFNTIALGDYLVHSRLIRDLKVKYNCNITSVCSPYNSRIIKKHSHIDSVIIYDENWSIIKKYNCLRKILKKKYYLSIVFDCKKFSMISNFLLKADFKRGLIMKKYKKIFSLKINLYYPSKIIAKFLYDKFVIHKKVKFIDKYYYLPYTWIDLLSDFKLKTTTKNIYFFNPNKFLENKKKELLKKINVNKYILFHLDHKWEDIIDINYNFFPSLINLSKKINKNILITSYNNNSNYFKNLEKRLNIFNTINNTYLKRNNHNIFLIKNPNIFLQERLISSSDMNISCHSGILVHGSASNNKIVVDILNSSEITLQKCWAPIKNYFVVKKSFNNNKVKISHIFNDLLKIISKY